MQETKKNQLKRRSDCPISFTLDIFGDKWTLMILRDIMFYDRFRFSDFMPREHIATNILADRLSKLESTTIIEKRQDTKFKNQYIYAVTPKGEALLPQLIEMTLWGLEYDPLSLASQEFIERVRNDKQKVVREITRAIKRGKFADYRSRQMGINSRAKNSPC